jgi:diacylglycerol kinase
MDKEPGERNRFSLIARIKSSTNAWRGIRIFMQSTHNAWVHFFFAGLAIYLGFILHISGTEWVVVILTIGIVILAETINTAIEIDINLTSPTYHPYARDTKDVAAGAVLMTTVMAGIVGLIIFLPKIVVLLK